MYIRRICRRNADGSVVSYLQLAHNIRDPQRGYTRAEVISELLTSRNHVCNTGGS
jgi:hypothetical protein